MGRNEEGEDSVSLATYLRSSEVLTIRQQEW